MLENILHTIGIVAVTIGVTISSWFGISKQQEPVGAIIPQAVALFETSLATAITSSATTMTLTSSLDKAGTPLATSTYAFVIDSGTSQEEMVSAVCVSTSCTGMTRGISPITGTSTVASLQYAHRRGASVKITDGPQLLILSRILNGQETVPNALNYNSHPTFTSDTQLVDKKYADDTIAGLVGTATDSAFGTVKLSVAAASTTNPIAVGDNDPRLLVDDSSIAHGTGNKLVTQTGLQNMSESYATSTGTTTSILLTLSPAPVALTAGMEVNFKSATTTTGATTLTLLGLATTTIKKLNDQDLISGDIEINQIVKVKYDGTYWQMLSPTASPVATVDIQAFTGNGTWTKPAGALKVLVQGWAGGGAGGGAAGSNSGGGGGGGAYKEYWFDASALGATEAVVVGAGGVGANNAVGGAGGNTTFDSFTVYGGGGGGVYAGGNGAGGGGGGQLSAGASAVGTSAGVGGNPLPSTAGVSSIFGGGIGAVTAAVAGTSFYGGTGGNNVNGSGNANGGAGGYGNAYGAGGAGTATTGTNGGVGHLIVTSFF